MIADKVFFNGRLITMTEDNNMPSALSLCGKIRISGRGLGCLK